MSGELTFVLLIVLVLVTLAIGVGLQLLFERRHRVMRYVLARLERLIEALKRKTGHSEPSVTLGTSAKVSDEERSRAELERLQHIIEDRKHEARESDISYHLWGLYRNHFRNADSRALDELLPAGEWYDVRILNTRTHNDLNEFEFELKGDRYRFVDDEEQQSWCENVKIFSLFLYDDGGRCLIEIPIKLRVDRNGRNYAVTSDGPRAFLPGDWVQEFISVKLKHQSMRNQEIRAQKHRERLSEIEELKERFGIGD